MGLTSITKAFDPVVPITRAALLALQGASNLVEGTTYAITDAIDALGGTVTMLALSNTQLESDGYWNFQAKLGAQGRFQLNSGAAGSVNQITVTTPSGPVTLLTAPVPFNTTRNQTALDVVTAINANTGVSGFRAWATTSTTSGDNFDQPYVYYESLVGQTAFIYTVSINVTTLTIASSIPATIGFNSENIQLLSKYDIVNDHILSAKDNKLNVSIVTTRARILSLGYNPVTTFRWNDPRLRSWSLTDSGVRNVAFKVAAASTLRDFILDNTIFERFSTTSASVSRVWIRNNGLLSNINGAVTLNNIRTAGFVVSNLDIGTLNITASDGGLTADNSTCGTATTRAGLNFLLSGGAVSFTGNAYRGTIAAQIGNNTVTAGGGIIVSNNTWVAAAWARCIIIQNNLQGGFTINANENLGELVIANNNFQSSGQITNCIFTGSNIQSIISNTLCGEGVAGGVGFNSFTLDQSTIAFDMFINNNKGAVNIPALTTISSAIFSISNCTIDNTYVLPLLSDCNLQYSSFLASDPSAWVINPLFPGVPVNLTVIESTIDNMQIEYCDTVTITGSSIKDFRITNNPTPFSTVTINRCKIEHTYIDTAPDPLTTINMRDTELIRGEYTTTYTHNFLTAPLNAGTPITITDQFWGYIKEKASVTAWNIWVESAPGVTFEIGDSIGNTYLTGLAAAVGAPLTFTQDATIVPPAVLSVGTVLEMRAVGGNITSGSAIIVVSGKYMYIVP